MTEPAAPRAAVLVGCGSVGRHHLEVLAATGDPVAVVDHDPDLLRQVAARPGVTTAAGSLAELAATGWPLGASRAVVATWGPSHAPLTHELIDRGVTAILVEKPMATSVADARAMTQRARAAGVALGVHLPRRTAGVQEGLRTLADRHRLGPPVAATVLGGARCLVTNGIHWLDLVCDLFGSLPEAVTSDARSDAINPRSADLRYLAGTATWSFTDERSLTVSFSNHSSVAETLTLWYRDAVVELTPQWQVQVRGRSADAVAHHPTVTRTGPASELLTEGPLPGVVDRRTATTRLWDRLVDPATAGVYPHDSVDVLGACLGALAAGATGRRTLLPLHPDDPAGRRRWPIS